MIWFHTAQHIKDIIMTKKYDINKVNGCRAVEVKVYVISAMIECGMSRFEIADYTKDITSCTYANLIEVSTLYLNECNFFAEDIL